MSDTSKGYRAHLEKSTIERKFLGNEYYYREAGDRPEGQLDSGWVSTNTSKGRTLADKWNEENTASATQVVPLNRVRCALVMFNNVNSSDQKYAYFVRDDEMNEPAVGDIVLTSMAERSREVEGVPIQSVNSGTIVEIVEGVHPKATKTYLLRIPRVYLESAQADQRKMRDKLRRRESAMTQLRKRFEDRNMLDYFSKQAEADPEIARLLDEARG